MEEGDNMHEEIYSYQPMGFTEYAQLCHFGVLGMKWGVRRFKKENKKALKREAKMQKYTQKRAERLRKAYESNAKIKKLRKKTVKLLSKRKDMQKENYDLYNSRKQYEKLSKKAQKSDDTKTKQKFEAAKKEYERYKKVYASKAFKNIENNKKAFNGYEFVSNLNSKDLATLLKKSYK